MSDVKVEKRAALGKGLSALLGDTDKVVDGDDTRGEKIIYMKVNDLHSGKFQPRRIFETNSLQELVCSIKESGIIQPIVVRVDKERGGFEIVAGERRWRAAKIAELISVPVVVQEMSDKVALEVSIVENIQRRDLTPVEEAAGYRRLMDDFSYTQEGIAKITGKSRSHVANMLRLLGLSSKIKHMIDDGSISMGHARALINVDNADYIAEKIVSLGMSVRETEELVRQYSMQDKENGKSNKNGVIGRSKELTELEVSIKNATGFSVKIKEKKGNKGVMEIEYVDLPSLRSIIERLVENSTN